MSCNLKANNTLLGFDKIFNIQKDIYDRFFNSLNNDKQKLFLDILEKNEIPKDILIKFNKYAQNKDIFIVFDENLKEDFNSCMFLLRYFNEIQFIEDINNLLAL